MPRVLDLRRRRGPSYLFGVAAKLTISLSTPTPEYLRLERSIVPHSVPLLLRRQRRRFETSNSMRFRERAFQTLPPPNPPGERNVNSYLERPRRSSASSPRWAASLSLCLLFPSFECRTATSRRPSKMKFLFFFFSRLRFSDHRSTESHPQTPHKALARQGGRSWARGDRRAGGLGSRVEGRVDLDERGGRSWPLSMRRATASSVSRSASRGDGRNIEIET